MQVGQHMITQKGLYTVLLVVVLVLLWFAKPFALIFWLLGSSALLILGHAAFIEPPVSSEYAGVEVRGPVSPSERVGHDLSFAIAC